MSTALPTVIKDSTADSRVNFRLVGTLVFFVCVGALGLYSFLFSGTILKSVLPEQLIPTPTINPVVAVSPTVVAMPTSPQIVWNMPVSTPTAVIVPTVAAPTPTAVIVVQESVVYVERPVEVIVERLVEAPTPTPTPPMQPGLVRICIYLEGVTGVYVNDVGVVGNSCADYPATALVNHWRLTVTR